MKSATSVTLGALISAFLCACTVTPTTQIKAFGDSTKAITDKVDAVITEYNQAALTRSFTDFAATYNGQFANRLTSEGLGELGQPLDERTKQGIAIYRANHTIGMYAESLGELAAAGSRAEIDTAAARLFGAMSGLNTQYKTLHTNQGELFSGSDFAATTKFIAAIGSTIVEKRRNAAIKEIVLAADPKISLLCDVIDKQLEESGIHEGISTARQYVLAEEIRDYKRQVQKDLPLEWRRNEIKRLYELKKGITGSKLAIQTAQKAIQEVKTAHNTLAEELRKDRFSSEGIARAVGRLRDLESHYNDYEALLLECKKIEKDNQGILSCNDL